MQLSDQQEHAVQFFVDWLDKYEFSPKPQVRRLFGYAGTGKTTIMKEISKRSKRAVQFCAFAGKAAMVLRSKGCHNAQTIHRTIYEPRGTAIKAYREELAKLERMTDPGEIATQEAKLAQMREQMNSPGWVKRLPIDFDKNTAFVYDEVSMVDQYIGQDSESYGFPILAVGDPAQLPPVMGTGYFTHGKQPDIMLTEIFRQEKDSPVLRLATAIRQGKVDFGYGKIGDSRVVPSLPVAEAATFDQILCGTNKTRMNMNVAVRKMQGRVRVLEIGEKLICLNNNYEVGIMNGSQWEVISEPKITENSRGFKFYRCDLKSLDEPGVFAKGALIHLNPLLEGRKEQDKHWTPMLTGEQKALVMTYGYCMTVHKSQGSQWNSVVIYDDWGRGNSYKEWLYTGVTRAAEKVTIVRGQ